MRTSQTSTSCHRSYVVQLSGSLLWRAVVRIWAANVTDATFIESPPLCGLPHLLLFYASV